MRDRKEERDERRWQKGSEEWRKDRRGGKETKSNGPEARPCYERNELVHCLLKDKHISSNAADHWQQVLHQQYFSALLPVDFSARSVEMRVV